ncbi:hypothetical protein V5F77_17965 [Xanthobacter sp. DSM 24535]|uniref:hypothetical protein n=1 Tax=Roseixanthobacter psychrophilus TaxID=3119917 RepID=UPI00372C8E74
MPSFLKQKAIAFAHPFEMRGIEGVQAAGNYIVETESERIAGMDAAYRLVATKLHFPADPASRTAGRIVPVNQTDVDAALLKDRDQTV